MEQPSLFDDEPERKFPDSTESLPFKGATFVAKYDQVRLTGQLKKIWDLMIDGKWRTCGEIHAILSYPENSIQAQLRNLRKPEFGTHDTPKRNRGPRRLAVYEYQLIPNEQWIPGAKP